MLALALTTLTPVTARVCDGALSMAEQPVDPGVHGATTVSVSKAPMSHGVFLT